MESNDIELFKQMLSVIDDVETGDCDCCPSCGGHYHDGHEVDCGMAKLKEAIEDRIAGKLDPKRDTGPNLKDGERRVITKSAEPKE